MSYIDFTKRSKDDAGELTVCVTTEESKILIPLLRKALEKADKKVDKYNDIHLSGEATERQENLRLKYESERDCLLSILAHMESLVYYGEES